MMRVSWLVSVLLVLGAVLVHASNVLDLTETKAFDEVVGKERGVLVEYFAPWCGHCQRLAPEYEKLADAFAAKRDKVVVAKVNGDANRDLAQRIQLRGFPTVMWYPPHTQTGVEYNGGRTAEDLAAFVTDQSRVHSRLQRPEKSSVIEVTAANFDEVVMDPELDVLVDFYAPWCGHCKKLSPVFDHMSHVFERDSHCKFVKIDVDDPANAEIKKRFQITSYPTLSFFPSGSNDKWPRPYLQERNVEGFLKFMNEKCGTFRNEDGSLSTYAGRMPALDGFASRFYHAAAGARAAIVDETTKYIDEMKKNLVSPRKIAAGQYYMRVMERVTRDGPEYVQRESQRLGRLLSKHAEGLSSLTAEKVDELTRKVNVLSAFTNERIGLAAERASSSAAAAAAQAQETGHTEL